ncbi:DUF2306 domain-containing protein [Aquimarina sp. 2201CG5-10]|uniref:DUF2306 domain-containing protein n=1 Tax=Aquimarina callyspongiae TaxID=3098150 RepID=UPI002AB3F395|nr:DUF2306 domain-containing protein [Aquimarina sp. 2201CG5-10]MDY8136462.1 DUF2306 domain-containing protein [Aquimarina sp. 2201CG5-10]
MKKLAWVVFVSCCLLFSFQPIKYYFADEPIGFLNSKPMDSYMYFISFYTHISLGGIALLIGWTQFSKKLRNRYLKLHRIIGKIYISSILIGGPFAFYLGFFVYGGLVTQIGFTFGAMIWILFTYLGYSAIRKGNMVKHKEYMMYSYAGTCAAIVLRLILPPLMMITSFKIAYGISVWMSWMPSVFLVYLFIHKKESLISFYKRFYIKQTTITVVVIAVLTVSLSFTSIHTWFYKEAAFKGASLEQAKSLSGSVFTKEKFSEIENYLKEESATTSMMVIENGKVVFEYGDVSEISNISSARQSIVSLLYGKHIENGKIDLQETIGSIKIEEDDGLLDIEKEATVEHLITSRSGVFHQSVDGSNHGENITERGSKKPGEYFNYNNWDFNVAEFILEKKSKNTVYEELEQQFAIPLGFEDWNVENQVKTVNKKTSRYPANHIYLSTRDMAKIGQLMLQEGEWKGKQLISKEWIQKITTVVTPKDTLTNRFELDFSSPLQRSYGYFWWLFERFYDNPDFKGAYTASGATSHFLTVIPKRNVVVVHKTIPDLLTLSGFSNRASTPQWQYWWILRNLMLTRKNISELEATKSVDEIIAFIKTEYCQDSEYGISERLINEYGLSLADKGNHKDAIKFFELNLKLYPNHGYYTHRILDYYGNSLVHLGRKKDALNAFKKSLQLNPDNPIIQKRISELKL